MPSRSQLTYPLLTLGFLAFWLIGTASAFQRQPKPVVVDLPAETAAAPAAATSGENPLSASAPAAAKPAAPPAAPLPAIRPAGLNGVTPGQTKAEELAAKLGEPVSTKTNAERELRSYRTDGFSQVEVTIVRGIVDSIVAHLKTPGPPADVAAELNLDSAHAAEVLDEQGEAIGWSFPERGITLVFAADSSSSRVAHIMLDSITAEPFLIRAVQDSKGLWQHDLADLAEAEERGCRDPRLLLRRAEILYRTGQTAAAAAVIQDAIRAGSPQGEANFLLGRLLGEAGQQTEAIALVSKVLDDPNLPPLVRATGLVVLGDLSGQGPKCDLEAAIKHYRASISLAAPLARDKKNARTRRAARQVLVDAHLAIARGIAASDFQNKTEAVSKWLRKGAELADEFQTSDGGPDTLRLHVYCQVIRAYRLAGDRFDAGPPAEAAIQEGRELIAASTDALQQHTLEWQLGEALVDAALTKRDQGKGEDALLLVDNASALLASAAGSRERNPHRDYTLAKAFYAIGSIQAICRRDHEEAVRFYDKSRELMPSPLPPAAMARLDHQGDLLVSMGVSYWELGRRDQAVQLCEEGLKFLQKAVELGQCSPVGLVIPYDNLATMHRSLGHADAAQHCVELARRYLPPRPASSGNPRTATAPSAAVPPANIRR